MLKLRIMSSKIFKRTKILATIGPVSGNGNQQMLEDMIMAGLNGCRINFSHAKYEEAEQQIAWIRAAAEKKGRSVAIMQDLQGPKIRLGEIKDNYYEVNPGDKILIDYAVKEHKGDNILPCQYNLAPKVKVGEPVFLFDGKVKSHVSDIPSDTAIELEVENSSYVRSFKGINLPETDFGGDIIPEKDLRDIEWGADKDFDYIAFSFVQTAEDIRKARAVMAERGHTAKLVAKIETKKAVESRENLEEIVKEVDGIMVARGDMATEAGAEIVPVVQRQLVELCREYGKLCIIATQTMGSMVENPFPSRAEVSDVANAEIQGADVVMLSDETAMGKYPLETVQEMRKVLLYTQNHLNIEPLPVGVKKEAENYDGIASAAAKLAEDLDADVIICQTATGATANAMATQRPTLPIISVTDQPRVANQLALRYANSSFVRPFSVNVGLDLARELKESGYLQLREGEDKLKVVWVSGDQGSGHTDTIKLRYV